MEELFQLISEQIAITEKHGKHDQSSHGRKRGGGGAGAGAGVARPPTDEEARIMSGADEPNKVDDMELPPRLRQPLQDVRKAEAKYNDAKDLANEMNNALDAVTDDTPEPQVTRLLDNIDAHSSVVARTEREFKRAQREFDKVRGELEADYNIGDGYTLYDKPRTLSSPQPTTPPKSTAQQREDANEGNRLAKQSVEKLTAAYETQDPAKRQKLLDEGRALSDRANELYGNPPQPRTSSQPASLGNSAQEILSTVTGGYKPRGALAQREYEKMVRDLDTYLKTGKLPR